MGKFSLVTAPGVQCFINGALVGEVRSIKWSSQTNRREIRGIDSAMPFELAMGTTKLSGQVGLYRKTGLGGLEGMGIASSFETAVRELYINIRIVQRQTGTVLFQCNTAVITAQEWEIAARQIMTGSFSFEGLSWENEIEPNL
jgi:hypothetical protein